MRGPGGGGESMARAAKCNAITYFGASYGFREVCVVEINVMRGLCCAFFLSSDSSFLFSLVFFRLSSVHYSRDGFLSGRVALCIYLIRFSLRP